jgi:hypothetical protein
VGGHRLLNRCEQKLLHGDKEGLREGLSAIFLFGLFVNDQDCIHGRSESFLRKN